MNSVISKTTVLVALATVLFSCKNDDLKDDTLEIDANKEFALTAPNGTTLEFKDAHITKYWDNRYSFFATTEGQYWNEIVSLMIDINNLSNYKTNEEIKVEKMDFGMFASSNSNYTTSEYKGDYGRVPPSLSGRARAIHQRSGHSRSGSFCVATYRNSRPSR